MKQLLKFYTENCQPCKQMTELLKEIPLAELGYELIEYDAVDEWMLAKSYGIRAVPTLIILGEERDTDDRQHLKTKTGMLTKDQLMEFLNA